MDIEKAFDNVWIEGLIYKLKNTYNCSELLIVLLYNYLTDRSFQVICKEFNQTVTSRTFDICAGTAQGSLLAPILLNLFLADIPKSAPDMPEQNFNIILYADDTLIYCKHTFATYASANVNAYLYTLNKYFSKWRLKLNTGKAQAKAFRRPAGRKRVPDIDIQINRRKVPIVTTLKYLGVHFSNLFKFSGHVNYTIQKCNMALTKLSPVLNPGNGTKKDIKILIYMQLIRPIATYAFIIWYNVSRNQIDKISNLERKCLRKCIDFMGPGSNNNKLANKWTRKKCLLMTT